MTFSTPTGSGGSFQFWSGGPWGSRAVNSSGVDHYIQTISINNVHSSSMGDWKVVLFEDSGGFPGEFITSVSSSVSLPAGNTTITLSEVVLVRNGEAIWVYIQQEGFIRFINSVLAYGGRVIPVWPNTTFIPLGVLHNLVLPVSFNNDGTPPTYTDTYDVPLFEIEPLTEGAPEIRVNDFTIEPLTEGYPDIHIALMLIESLHPIPLELPVSTEPFPGFGSTIDQLVLPGLAFSVHKKPMFKTNIKESASGVEVRTSVTEYPRWDFELTYEFLEDRTGAESSLKTIMGFFLQRRGSFDTFLFKDPDDYVADFALAGVADGTITEFPLRRSMGGFLEKVCQLDTDFDLDVYHGIVEATSIPVTPGPYTVTVTEAADFYSDLGVTKGGIAMTRVAASPAASQYSVDLLTGIYTFNATDQGDAIEISYSYLIDNTTYEVVMPNLIVFDSAPSEGSIYASFQFFFACRFVEDQMDFEKFVDKLWSLQECNFRSVIQ